MTDLALVYLARGDDNGLLSALRFFSYYRTFRSGKEHNLYLLLKGWEKRIHSRELLCAVFRPLKPRIIFIEDDGYDWGAYLRAVKRGCFSEKYVCFLNTHSRPICHGWLQMIYSGIENPEVGICGATGSYSNWRYKRPTVKSIKSLLTFVLRVFVRLKNHLLFSRYYSKGPNAHLRSNAFAVNTGDFLRFARCARIPRRKKDAYLLESGKKSFCVFVVNKLKKKMVVASANGCHFFSGSWKESGTYASMGQVNLLVSDNDTDRYFLAGEATRADIEYDTWG